MRLILASQSLRRQELLKQYSSDFRVVESNVSELLYMENPYELAEKNADLKALKVFETHNQDCIIAADTIINFNGQIFNKPKDFDDAKMMLRTLSGQTHEVITGVCVISSYGKHLFHEVTNVTFKDLTDQIIDNYLTLIDFHDKSGGYAIQEHRELIVDHYDGLLSNVIGLPIERISQYFMIESELPSLNEVYEIPCNAIHKMSVRAVISKDNAYGLIETYPYALQNRTHHYVESCGGGLYFGEPLDKGLIREVFEETGFNVDSFTFIGKYIEMVEYDKFTRVTHHYMALVKVTGNYCTRNRMPYEKELLGNVIFKTFEEWTLFFENSQCSTKQKGWGQRDFMAICAANELSNKF